MPDHERGTVSASIVHWGGYSPGGVPLMTGNLGLVARLDEEPSNSRCAESWQACKRAFESSLLGTACRQVFGGKP